MRKYLILLLLIICQNLVFSQVQFESISFDDALLKAKNSGQFIFLQFESSSCDQCNEVANKAFEDKKLSDRLNQGFISIKIGPNHPDRNNVAYFYDKENFFGSLFISSDGALIHTYHQTTTMADMYLKQIDIALSKASEGFRVNELEKQYRNDSRNIFLIEQLLILRKDLYLNTDSLLDEYISLLPADSLHSLSELAFIIQQYPIIGSKADMAVRKDYQRFYQAWNALALPVRIGVNNRIINKSMKKAIREKNVDYVHRVASFAQSTFTTDARAGSKAYDSNILEFYKQTHDTLNYLARVVNYYDSYYMTVSIDSVKQKDSIAKTALLAKQNPEKVTVNDTTRYRKSISYSPTTQFFTSALTEGAQAIFSWTNNPVYLKKGLEWASRANQFYDSPEAMDTYARLLYKTKNETEAIIWESKAIELRKKRGFKTTAQEKALANMKSGNQVNDN